MKLPFHDIKGSDEWTSIEQVEKGWSQDRKYKIETISGDTLLLRLADRLYYDQKKIEYHRIQKWNGLHFQMSRALSFGLCNDGEQVYVLLTWVDGLPLIEALPHLSEQDQYRLGWESGANLKAAHSLPVEEMDLPKYSRRDYKLEKLNVYEASNLRVPGDEYAISYIRKHLHLMDRNPPVYMHGDYHVGNLIYTPSGGVGVIDFNRHKCGDPNEEFLKIQSFDVEVSIPFSIGQIHGYFRSDPPRDFWEAVAVYVAHTSLTAINWAEAFGPEEVKGMQERCFRAFDDYDYFRIVVPHWYKAYEACQGWPCDTL